MLPNLPHNLLYSDLQDDFMDQRRQVVIDQPVVKGVRHGFTVNPFADGQEDRQFWITYNPCGKGDIHTTIPSCRTIDLIDIESKSFDESDEDVLFMQLRAFDIDTSAANLLRPFDFLSGNIIQGSDSGARASVKGVWTRCRDNERGEIFYAAVLEGRVGEFVDGENIQVVSLTNEYVRSMLETQRHLFQGRIPNFNDILNTADTGLYRTLDEFDNPDFDQAKCLEFYKFKSMPEDYRIDYNSFAKNEVLGRGCEHGVASIITLRYMPELVCPYNPLIVCDWNDASACAVTNFPYQDFLTGQVIRGWQSGAEGTVTKVEVIREPKGGRIIKVWVDNPTQDFFAEESIEVVSLDREYIRRIWHEQVGEFSTLPGFWEVIDSIVDQPYKTVTQTEQAFYSGQIDDMIADAFERIGVMVNGVSIPSTHFRVTASMADTIRWRCHNDCVIYPHDQLFFSVDILSGGEIGHEILIKTDLVPGVENNGAGFGETMWFQPKPEDVSGTVFYLADTHGGAVLRLQLEDMPATSREFTFGRILPEDWRCEFPGFERFMRHDMLFAHLPGMGKEYMQNQNRYDDINVAPVRVLGTLARDNIAPVDFVPHLRNSRTYQKEFTSFWLQNARPVGTEFLFDTVWDKDAEILHKCMTNPFHIPPKQEEFLYVKSVADAMCVHWDQRICDWDDTKICDLIGTEGGITIGDIYEGFILRGVESLASGLIEGVKDYVSCTGTTVTQISLSHKLGTFEDGEPLEITDTTLGEIYAAMRERLSENVNLPPSYIENILATPNLWVNIGGVIDPERSEIVDYQGSFKFYSRLYPAFNELKCMDTPMVVVELSPSGAPTKLEHVWDGKGNHGWTDGYEVVLWNMNGAVRRDGIIWYRIRTRDTEINNRKWIDAYQVIDKVTHAPDKYWTMPNTYVLSVDMSRNEYIDVWRETVGEAGELMISERPFTRSIETRPCVQFVSAGTPQITQG